MQHEHIIGAPINVGGHEVVLIEDAVGRKEILAEPLLLESSDSSHPDIWVDEQSLMSLREKNPGLPIYGLWQLLYANGLVASGGLQVIRTGATSGHYILHTEPSDVDHVGLWNGLVVESGEYIGNRIASHMTLNPDIDGVEICFDHNELVLPRRPARLAMEIRAERSKLQRKVLTHRAIAASVALAFIGSALLVNWVRDSVNERSVMHLQSQLNGLTGTLRKIEANHIMEWPEPFPKLSGFVVLNELVSVMESASGGATFNLNDEAIEVYLPKETNKSSIPDLFTVQREPDGKLKVTWASR